jgi:hypothetical protein
MVISNLETHHLAALIGERSGPYIVDHYRGLPPEVNDGVDNRIRLPDAYAISITSIGNDIVIKFITDAPGSSKLFE